MIDPNKIIKNILGNTITRKKSFRRKLKQDVTDLYKHYHPDINIAAIKAVEDYNKPIASINILYEKKCGFKTNLSYLIIKIPNEFDPRGQCTQKIYYRPETKYIAIKYKKLYDDFWKKSDDEQKLFMDEYHRQSGELLGYPKDIVEEWIKLQK